MIKKKKHEIIMPLCILLFSIISIISIYNSQSILSNYYNNLYIKQLIWYVIGFIIFIILLFIKNEKILRNYISDKRLILKYIRDSKTQK